MAVDLATLNIQFAADVAGLEAALSSAQSSIEGFKASTADLTNISFTGDSAPLIGATDEAKGSLTSFKEEAAGLGAVQFSGDAAPLIAAIDEGKGSLTSFKEEAAGLGSVELRGDAAPLTAAIGEAKGELDSYKASADEGATVMFTGDAAPLATTISEAEGEISAFKTTAETEGHVTLTADAAPLVGGMGEAQAATSGFVGAAAGAEESSAGLERSLGSIGAAAEESSGGFGVLEGALGGVTANAESLAGTAGILAVAGAFTITGDEILKANVQFDKSSASLTALTGDAQSAQEQLEAIENLGLQEGFSIPGLEKADQAMVNMGLSAEQTVPIIKAVAEGATAVGTGQEGVEQVTNALKRMETQGEVSSRTMMALVQNGIPIYQELAGVLGTDVAGAMDAVKKHTVDADTVIQTIIDNSGNLGPQMEAHAQTFEGAVGRIGAAVEVLGTSTFRGLFESVTGVTNVIADYVTGIAGASTETERMQAVFGPLTPIISGLESAWTAASGAISSFISGAVTNLAPILQGIADIMGPVLTPAMAMFQQGWERLQPALAPLAELLGGVLKTALEVLVPIIAVTLVAGIYALATAFDFIGTVIGALTPVFQTMADLWNGAADLLAQVPAKIGPAWDQLRSMVSGALSAVGDTISSVLGSIGSTISGWVSSVGSFFSGLGSTVTAVVSSAFDTVRSVISTALSGVGSTISGWVSSVGSFFSGLGSSIGSVVSSAFSTLGSIIGSALNSLTDSRFHPWIALVVGMFKDLATLLPAALSTAWTAISTGASTALATIGNIISTGWNYVSSITSTIWDAISSFFSAFWADEINGISIAVSAIETAISTGWNYVSTITSSVWDAIRSYLQSWWDWLYNTLISPALTNIENVISTGWNYVSTITSSVWDAIRSYLQSWWDWLYNTLISPAITNIENVISTGWNYVSTITTSVYDSIASFLTSWWDTLTAGFNTAVDTIESLLSSAWDTIASTAATGWGIIKDNIVTPVIEAYDKVVDVMNGIIEAVAGVLSKIAPNTAAALQGFELSKISFGTGGATEGSPAGDGSTQSFATGGVSSQTPGYTEERLVEWGEKLQPGQREYFLTEHPDYKERNFALWQDYGSRQGFVPREIVNQDSPATSVPWAQAQQNPSSAGAPAMSFATGGKVWQDILTGNPATDLHNVMGGVGASPNLSFSSPGSTNNAPSADFSQTNNTTNIFNSVMINGQQVSGGSAGGSPSTSSTTSGATGSGSSAGPSSSVGGTSGAAGTGLLNISMPAAMWQAMQQDDQAQNAAALLADFDPSKVQMTGSGAAATPAGGSPSGASPTLSAASPAGGGTSTSQNTSPTGGATAIAGGAQAQSFAPVIQQAAAASSAPPAPIPASASQPTNSAAPSGSAPDTSAPATSPDSSASGSASGVPSAVADMQSRAEQAIGSPYVYGDSGVYAGSDGYSCSGLWDWIIFGATGDPAGPGTYEWDAGVSGFSPGPGNVEVGVTLGGGGGFDDTHMSGDIYGTPYESDTYDGVSYGAFMGGAQNFPDVWHMEGYASGGIAGLIDKYRNPGMGGSSQIQSYVQQRFNQQLSANLGGGSSSAAGGAGGTSSASPSGMGGSGSASGGSSLGSAGGSLVSLSVPQNVWSQMVSDDQSGDSAKLLSDFDPSQFHQESTPSAGGTAMPGSSSLGSSSSGTSSPSGSSSGGFTNVSTGQSNVVDSQLNQSFNQIFKNPTSAIVQMARGGIRFRSFQDGGYDAGGYVPATYDSGGNVTAWLDPMGNVLPDDGSGYGPDTGYVDPTFDPNAVPDWGPVAPSGYADPATIAADQAGMDATPVDYSWYDPAWWYDYYGAGNDSSTQNWDSPLASLENASGYTNPGGLGTTDSGTHYYATDTPGWSGVVDTVQGWASDAVNAVGSGASDAIDTVSSWLGFARGGMRGGGQNLTFRSPNLTNNAPSADFSGSGNNMNNSFQSVMINGQQMLGGGSGIMSSTPGGGGSSGNVQSTVSNSSGGAGGSSGGPADVTIAPGMTSSGLVSPGDSSSNVVSSDYSQSYDTVYVDPTQPIVQMARGGIRVPRFSFADGGSLTGAQIQAGLDAGNAAVGDFYQPGGVGPPGDGYDCSGLWNWIESGIAYGSPVAERRWGTFDMPAPGWQSGTGQVTVGVGTSGWGGPDGSHMAGNVTGTGFEADEAPGDGVTHGGISGADPFAFDNQYFLGDTSYVGTSTSGSGAIHALAKAAMDGVIGTVIDPLLGGTWPGGVVGQGMQEFAKTVPTKVEDWVLGQLPGGGGGTSGSGSASSGADLPSDAQGWITQGLADTGEPASWAPDIAWIMNHESGGQNIDNLEGSSATGPMQLMPDTFNAYQVVGHPDINNPQDNVDAALNYIEQAYGSPSSIGGVGQSDWPGYASGGIITKPQLAWLGEGGSPEAVVPLDDPSKIANFVNTFAPPSGLSNSYAPPVGGGSGGAGGLDPAMLAQAVEDGLKSHTDAVTGAIKDNTNMDISNVDDLAKAMIVGAHSYATSDLGKKTMDSNLAQGLNQFVQYLPASQ